MLTLTSRPNLCLLDLFEVAFANRLSKQLCWPVVYRKWWNAELPSPRGLECLPNASLPRNVSILPISRALQRDIDLNEPMWNYWSRHHDKTANGQYDDWVQNMQEKGSIAHLQHLHYDFTGNAVDELVRNIKSPSSPIQVVSMRAFFIHYDWMKDWIPEIRNWLQVSPSCCHHTPPSNAIVMHVRDFNKQDQGYKGIQPNTYVEILKQYYYNENTTTPPPPLWIVCQPKTTDSDFVNEIRESIKTNLTIVPGQDQYDAFCTLTRAKTLILSTISSYSQMAALLNHHGQDDVVVHYPILQLEKPKVTLKVPQWHYHLINDTKDGIQEWDVTYKRIIPKMG